MPEMSGQLNGNGNGNGAGRTSVPLFSQVVLRSQSDPRLMQLASNGNDAAIEVLLQRYRKPLLQYCSRLIDPARAEDIVQQTFEKAIAQLRGEQPHPPHQALALPGRAQRRHRRDAPDGALLPARRSEREPARQPRATRGAPAAAHGDQGDRQASAAAAHGPAAARDGGRSFEEIASELDSSVEGVYQLLRRARQQLRDKAAALVPLPLVRWAIESRLAQHRSRARR